MSKNQEEGATFEKILGEIISATTLPTIKFELTEDETNVFNSKIGGKPYLPKDFEYPTLRGGDNHPLVMYAQINFEEFEHIPDFPTTGILQFYIDACDDMYGMPDDYLDQEGFRVIYHENITTDTNLLVDPPNVPIDDVPFECCLKMKGKKIDTPMTSQDFRMKTLIKKYSMKYNVNEAKLHSFLVNSEQLANTMTGIGGYCSSTQEDVRHQDSDSSNYTVTLFTSDSATHEKVSWVDAGIANFAIEREQLTKKDFRKVMYFWDCY
ncbi:YwqG family protein [Entamoeba marina]